MRDGRVLDGAMNDAFAKALAAALRNGAPLDESLRILRLHRDHGATQAEVAEALNSIRVRASTEAEEDRILELMEVVHGFCSPHMRLY